MREFIIADNQDISKAGMMFLLSKQKEVSLLLEADNKAELIQQLRLYPQAVIILDYTLFHPQTKVYLQSCQQSAAFGNFFSAGSVKYGRPFADADRKEYPKRNCIRENNERDCRREKS